MNDAERQAAYLEARFLEYFPTSSVVVDNETDDETIHVHVQTSTGEPNHFRLTSWVMNIGSDDDCYDFATADGDVRTIPFQPEVE